MPNYNAQEREGRAPAYYAMIPASVRYDNELRASAKLLYGELTALCDKTGYCWATNKYFADLYGLSEKTITELLLQLEKRGHIRREVIRDEKNEVVERRIYVGVGSIPPSPEKSGDPSPEKSGDPPPKNVRENNINNNNTPLPPKGDDAEEEAFKAFWAAYPNKADKKVARRAFHKVYKKFGAKLSLDVLLKALEKQKRSDQWTRDGGRYIPNPSTWLNGERWEDDLGAPAPEREKPKRWEDDAPWV